MSYHFICEDSFSLFLVCKAETGQLKRQLSRQYPLRAKISHFRNPMLKQNDKVTTIALLHMLSEG